PTNVLTDDGDWATAQLSAGAQTSSHLVLGGFDLSAVPDVATPVGMLLEVKRSKTGGGVAQDGDVKARKAGVAVGGNLAQSVDWPSGDTWTSYGGMNSLWTTSWTVADWKDPGFGFQIGTQRFGGSPL